MVQVGPAGVGKSQFCFMMALQGALPKQLGGLGGSVMYIDTEMKFSSQRLMEMARSRHPGPLSSRSAMEEVLTRVLIQQASTGEDLLSKIQALLDRILAHDVVLVIIDSIAAPVRVDYQGSERLVERQKLLGRQAAALKAMAYKYNIPVLVVNQVTARLHHHVPSSGAGATEDSLAALGTKWSHCVNLRLLMERQADRRWIRVDKAPTAPNVMVEYQITNKGPEQVGQ